MKDQLYLMQPGFMNAGLGPFYCGDSVSIEGLLGFFPELREAVDVTYIAFPRPRQQIVDRIGEDHQSVPVLILADESTVPDGVTAEMAKLRRFISDEKGIRKYLSITHGLPQAG